MESAASGESSRTIPVRSTTAAVAFDPDLEVPIPHRRLTRGLFALIQVMYLIFYASALFRLHAIWGIADSMFPGWGATSLVAAVMVTAGVGIPLRCYLISAVGFDYQRLGDKFKALFPFVLALDQLWAVAPFLLIGEGTSEIQKIVIGADIDPDGLSQGARGLGKTILTCPELISRSLRNHV